MKHLLRVLWLILLTTSAHAGLNQDFSLKMFRAVMDAASKKSDDPGNLVFSPYAARHALGVAAFGAKGATLKQLGRPVEVLSSPGDSFKLWVASRMWVQRDFPVREIFKRASDQTVGVVPWMVDFTQAPDFLRDRINGWVQEQTAGHFRNFISMGDIDPSTRVLLTNAFYFKSAWAKSFESLSNKLGRFQNDGEKPVRARVMRQVGTFPYFQNHLVEVVEIPFHGGETSLLVFLPAQGRDVQSLEKFMKPEGVERWISMLAPKELKVSLPRFDVSSTYEMTDILKSVGVEEAFNPDVADFSTMTGKRDLYLGKFIHRTKISVQPWGTEGSSGSVGAGVGERVLASADAVPFEANRPFFFAVRHRGTHSFLMLGRVTRVPALEESED